MRKEVNAVSRRLKVSKARAFVIWFALIALDLSEDEAMEATGIEGANDKDIDLLYVDKEDGKVIIVQGKGSENGTHRPKKKEVASLLACLNWLASPEAIRQDGKPDLAAAADDYMDAVREGYGVELWFVYAGPKCPNIEKEIAVFNQNPDNTDSRKACRHCDIELLQTNFEEFTGNAKRLDTEKVSLVDGKHFVYTAEFGDALVGTVPGTELIRIYKKYEDRLFDRNVRLFLGAKKGSVNAVIAETLKSHTKCNFWAYNNGLTLVCREFDADKNSVTVHDFCIVNGCQSTRSLVENETTVDPTVTVLMRVLAVPNEVVDDVIRFTNSQNPIRPWDLASQHKTQRRLKKQFDELKKPYIYLTRRGDQPRAVARYKNGGRPRQIKLADVGQYVAALKGHAVLAYKDKALIFSSRHDDVFPHDIKVEEVLFAWICGEEVREVVGKRRKDTENEDEQRILIKGGSLFVMAALGVIASLRNGATYLKALAEEQITSNAGKERLRKYARYALEAYLRSVKDTQENSGEELTTLIRSRQFFTRVKDRIEGQYRKEALAGQEWLKNALPKLI
jgi:hypothetical protein